MEAPSVAIIVQIFALAEKYGPVVFQVIKDLTSKKDATIDDVEKAYSGLRTYASFGIPDQVPQTDGQAISK